MHQDVEKRLAFSCWQRWTEQRQAVGKVVNLKGQVKERTFVCEILTKQLVKEEERSATLLGELATSIEMHHNQKQEQDSVSSSHQGLAQGYQGYNQGLGGPGGLAFNDRQVGGDLVHSALLQLLSVYGEAVALPGS